ncbi:MAG: glycosyltransferase family 39 protein, partial [Candidatus Hydrogenedentes bacterium]|nr:glycosyltransferase family 39 protein [Candidatus Hydrogenedentota bacterium]
LFGIASVPLMFLAGRALFRDNVSALLAALLFAVNPFQIFYAQELRIYAFYVFIWLVAIYCLVNALEHGAWRWWIGLVLCEVLSVYSHFISIWTVFTINVFFLIALWHYRKYLWRWTASQALVVALVAPILPTAFYLNNLLATKSVKWYPDPTLTTGLFTVKDFFAGYGATPWAYWGIFLLGGGLCALGILSCWRRWPMGVLIAVLIVVPVAGNLAMWSLRSFSFYEHRLFIFSGVAALLAAAQGLRVLRWRIAIALVTALYLLLTAPLLRDTYLGRIHPDVQHRVAVYDKVDLRSPAAYIKDHWQPGDLIAHASHFTVYPMHHYLDLPSVRLGWTEDYATQMLDTFGPVQEPLLTAHGLMPVPVAQATQGVNRIWWIETFGNTFEAKQLTEPLRAWLDQHYDRAEQHEYSGALLVLYTHKHDPQPEPQPAS